MIEWNFLLVTFIVVFWGRSGCQYGLHRLNLQHLRQKGCIVPPLFQDAIDPEKFRRIADYTAESSHFALMSAFFHQAVSLAILLSGFLPGLASLIESLDVGVTAGGLIFFAVLSAVTVLLRLPFELYDVFVIEERYGFNAMTFKMWLADLIKGLAVQAVLGGLFLGLLMTLVIYGGKLWWLWAWIILGVLELFLLWIFPLVVAPLFNKFEPLQDRSLAERIESLMSKVGLRVKGIFQMDASKRSKHTNAYFTGMGRSKRIVLFDTLLKSHTGDEILAVLAHEAGHWKKKHLLKQIVPLEGVSLLGLFLVSRLLEWPLLYRTFGFETPILYGGLFLIGALLGPLGFFAQPLESAISRRFEKEADDFSVELTGRSDGLRNALKRLASDNLSNLLPHPLYAWFYYSHPPLGERLSRLAKEKMPDIPKFREESPPERPLDQNSVLQKSQNP
jgi:STE24 endopeptidase